MVANKIHKEMPKMLFGSQFPVNSQERTTTIVGGSAMIVVAVCNALVEAVQREGSRLEKNSAKGQSVNMSAKKPETVESAVKTAPIDLRKKKSRTSDKVAIMGKTKAASP